MASNLIAMASRPTNRPKKETVLKRVRRALSCGFPHFVTLSWLGELFSDRPLQTGTVLALLLCFPFLAGR